MIFHDNIMELARANNLFRQELITATHSQVVVMSIPPGQEIGQEKHTVDQTLVFVQGNGLGIVGQDTFAVAPNSLVLVPAGTVHNFKNTGTVDLKLFTIYAPPQHKPGTVDRTKADAEKREAAKSYSKQKG